MIRLLIGGQEAFVDGAGDVLRAGLETADWISVDDTGARHGGKNAVCTQSRKLGLSFWAYLGNRIGAPDAPANPPLPDITTARAAPA